MIYKILNSVKKSHFIFPKKKFYLGKIKYYCPYYLPRNFMNIIFNISKDRKKYNRNKSFKLFGYNISYGSPIVLHRNDLGWKDKYNSPRFEWSPSFILFFFNWQFCIFWTSPDDNDDNYWEQFLWYSEYSDRNIKKAEETWGWTSKGVSTWNKSYLKYTLADERDKKIEEILCKK